MDAFGAELRITPEVLNQMMSDAPAAAPPRPSLGVKRKTLVQHVIALALHYPQAAAQITEPERLEQLTQPGAELLRRILALARSLSQPTTAQLMENLRDDPDYRFVERLLAEEPLDGPEAAPSVLNDALTRMVEEVVKSRAAEAVRAHRPGPTQD